MRGFFPSDPPKIPGVHTFGATHRHRISPFEKPVAKPFYDRSNAHMGYFGSLVDFFGFEFEFDGGKIIALDSYDQTLEYLSVICNRDGFLYPPEELLVQLNPATGTFGNIEEPRSSRPANMFSLPPTHQIMMNEIPVNEDFRKEVGAFILGLLSMLFETRLQFNAWLIDSRVRLKSGRHNIYTDTQSVNSFLSSALAVWNTWPRIVKIEMVNVLHIRSKIDSYESLWEKFLSAYLVFDGCFSICSRLYGLRAKSHKQRFGALCDHFQIAYDKEAIDEIYRLRNDLFHHITWDKGVFGFPEPGSSWWRASDLEKLTLRLIIGICGYRGRIFSTNWTDDSAIHRL